MIPSKCKYCPYLDYDESDDDRRSHTPLCVAENGCVNEEVNREIETIKNKLKEIDKIIGERYMVRYIHRNDKK